MSEELKKLFDGKSAREILIIAVGGLMMGAILIFAQIWQRLFPPKELK